MFGFNNNKEAESTASPSGAGDVNAGPAVLYEIMHKVTGVCEPVSHNGSGDLDGDMDADFFCHKEDGTEVVFKRNGQDDKGNAIFENDEYLIRSRDTKMALDGVTPVPDVVPPTGNATAAPAHVEGTVNDAVYFNVYDKDGAFVRRYSSVEHEGVENAENFANNFAKKIGGTVKKS